MDQAVNKFYIDGVDLYMAFGYIVSGGSDDFLKLPTRKDPPSHSWLEESGVEYDLSAPAFESVPVTLAGYIIADSEADFWNKYQSLWNVLSAPGERILNVIEHAQTYLVFYKKAPVSKKLTRLKGTDLIAFELSLEFQVIGLADGMEPGSNGGFVDIVNQAATVIATVQAPGEYAVIEFSGIQDDGSGTYTNSIIDNQ